MYLYLNNSIYLNTYMNNNSSTVPRSEIKVFTRSYKVSAVCILKNRPYKK